MEEKSSSSKKVLLSVLGVAILVVAVVGISFAVFSFTNSGAGDNSITTGTITMSFAEPEAGLALIDQLPITDVQGKAMTEYFQFSVSTTATGKVSIPYEISITPVNVTAKNPTPGSCANGTSTTSSECTTAGSVWTAATSGLAQLPAANVKVYLTKMVNTTEVDVVAPALISTFTKVSTLRPAGQPTAYVIKTITDDYTAAAGSTTVTYKLRMWIDEATVVNAWTANTNYQYKLKVNVDSKVAPLS